MPEEEAFCVLVQLMSKYKMREMYKPSMADLSICFYQLEKIIEVSPLVQQVPLYSKSCDHQWVWFIAGVLPHPLHAFQGCGKPGGGGRGGGGGEERERERGGREGGEGGK